MADQQHNDQQLVARVQKETGVRLIIGNQISAPYFLSLVGRYISDYAEAQDVAQESLCEGLSLPYRNFRGESQFYTGMYPHCR